jgi:hypothetical protein
VSQEKMTVRRNATQSISARHPNYCMTDSSLPQLRNSLQCPGAWPSAVVALRRLHVTADAGANGGGCSTGGGPGRRCRCRLDLRLGDFCGLLEAHRPARPACHALAGPALHPHAVTTQARGCALREPPGGRRLRRT